MTIYAEADAVYNGCCGLGVVYDFSESPQGWKSPLCESFDLAGGTGFVVVGFINEPMSKDTYTQLCRTYKLVYQSPVRTNTNSGNPFFFCLFDRGAE